MPPPPNPKAKQEIIASLASRLFDDMVSELQFDTVLRARKDADRSKQPCKCCGTHCSLPHTPGASTSGQTRNAGISNATGSSGSGTPTKESTNVYLTCPICKQPIASNRGAHHLSKCMGGRRSAKNKKLVEDRSSSPYVDLSDEYINASASQKSKSKKKDSNGTNKRPGSPSLLGTPSKKVKKSTTNSDAMSVASSKRKLSSASSTIEATQNTTYVASPSESAYSGSDTHMSTDSGGSALAGSGGGAGGKKAKKNSTGAGGAAPRGPPGSWKGRMLAAARLGEPQS